MKTLYVLRHAKSSWDDPTLPDFERTLNERGYRDAPRIAGAMTKRNFLPDLIVASPAVRTTETAEIVKKSAAFTAKIRFNPHIYEASLEDLLAVITETPDNVDKLLLVGHNSGVETLVGNLTGEFRSMPTAALAAIRLNVNAWNEIKTNCGELIDFFSPKELPE